MKIFFSEHLPDYEKYYFPYQVWLFKEENDNEELIYEKGFLPIRNFQNMYYLSRSLRVDLNDFDLSSENRRILNKTEEIGYEVMALSDFKYDFSVQNLCKNYSDERLNKVFSGASIKSIFTNGIFNHVLIFKQKSNNKRVGYVICNIKQNLLHFAHSFYDTNLMELNLGAGMMLSSVIWAKENLKRYVYLGTCYQEKALYKTEFKGIEFFNGFSWSKSIQELKYLIDKKNPVYLLKDFEYLENYYNSDLKKIIIEKGIKVDFK